VAVAWPVMSSPLSSPLLREPSPRSKFWRDAAPTPTSAKEDGVRDTETSTQPSPLMQPSSSSSLPNRPKFWHDAEATKVEEEEEDGSAAAFVHPSVAKSSPLPSPLMQQSSSSSLPNRPKFWHDAETTEDEVEEEEEDEEAAAAFAPQPVAKASPLSSPLMQPSPRSKFWRDAAPSPSAPVPARPPFPTLSANGGDASTPSVEDRTTKPPLPPRSPLDVELDKDAGHPKFWHDAAPSPVPTALTGRGGPGREKEEEKLAPTSRIRRRRTWQNQ